MGIKKLIWSISIGVFLLLIVGGTWIFFSNCNTVNVVERKLDIKLMNKVSIVEEQRTVEYGEEHVCIKLLIKDGELQSINQLLEKSFLSEFPETMKIPNFKNTCSWWDLNEDYITSQYYKMVEGKRAKTIEIWAFVVKESENEYLYLSY